MVQARIDIRPAPPGAGPAARELLVECGLTLAGLDDPRCRLWLAHGEGRLVGVAGLEQYGEVGLLRSVATRGAWRGRGVADALCRRVLDEAAAGGIARLCLLTETAEGYFRRLGFETVPRASADPRLSASAEFQGGHCVSAVLMERRVG